MTRPKAGKAGRETAIGLERLKTLEGMKEVSDSPAPDSHTDERTCEKFKRKQKYLVLKIDDIDSYLSESRKMDLNKICKIIESRRFIDGKPNHGYVVVADDESYVEQVWNLIEKHWQPREARE